MDLLSTVIEELGLKISIKNTEVMYQPTTAATYTEPTITVGSQKLAVADKFTYLGHTLSRRVTTSEEVNYRIACESIAFGKLQTNVWEWRGISF